tara:strand:+ start:1061 stop:1420 length:360 start_codon:yes stop_codon:yes gene_type:complete
MGNRYAAGKHTIAECDRCGFRYKLKELKPLVIRGKHTNIFVCPPCFEKDHPQNRLGLYPVEDPQAIRNPRPDLSRFAESDARNYQFGFNPVGLSDTFSLDNINDLVGTGGVGTVTVTTS